MTVPRFALPFLAVLLSTEQYKHRQNKSLHIDVQVDPFFRSHNFLLMFHLCFQLIRLTLGENPGCWDVSTLP